MAGALSYGEARHKRGGLRTARAAMSVLISVAVLFSMSPTAALAAPSSTTVCIDGEILTAAVSRDDAGARTIQVTGDDESSIVTLNKRSRIISGSTQVDGRRSAFVARPPRGVTMAAVVPLGGNGDMFWRHRYSRSRSGTTTNWHTEKSPSVYKNTPESSRTSADLHGFADAVDSCLVNEIMGSASVGTAVAAATAGAIAAAGTVCLSLIVGILIALGALATAAGYFLSAWTYKCHADFHYGGY